MEWSPFPGSKSNDSIDACGHPSKNIIATSGREFYGSKIILCITASVAAYKAIDLSRLLMRHGADVHAVISKSAESRLITADIMKWATGNEVLVDLTGNLEHISLADYGKSDLVLVYPCTANTLGKMANGIDDTSVTAVLSVAVGSKIPIILAPAMHEAMYHNELIKRNVQRLKDIGIEFLEPGISEGKAKLVEPERVLKYILGRFCTGRNKKISEKALHHDSPSEPYRWVNWGRNLLSGMKILVTAGSTVEHIDSIRVITNLSSGKMGIAIAQQADRMGADVTLILGHVSYNSDLSTGKKLNLVRVSTGEEMYQKVMSELVSNEYDVSILAAAVADFAPNHNNIGKRQTAIQKRKKIDTRISEKLQLSLIPTRKIVDEVKNVSINKKIFLVAFKAEYDVSDKELVEKAYAKLKESKADVVVANDVGRKASMIGSDYNEIFVVSKQKGVLHFPIHNKVFLAGQLLGLIKQYIDIQ
jgi:phosphopantothenoylcysteine decarboxylase / phosphopantothenate---cysteine ligase